VVAVGYDYPGVELDAEYFHLAERALPRLAALDPGFKGSQYHAHGLTTGCQSGVDKVTA
jgi:hypothetical protein